MGQVGKAQTRVRKTSRKSVKVSSHMGVMKEEVVVAPYRNGGQLLSAPPAWALQVFPKSGHGNILLMGNTGKADCRGMH